MSSVVVGVVQCECEITYLAQGSKCRLDNEIHKTDLGLGGGDGVSITQGRDRHSWLTLRSAAKQREAQRSIEKKRSTGLTPGSDFNIACKP